MTDELPKIIPPELLKCRANENILNVLASLILDSLDGDKPTLDDKFVEIDYHDVMEYENNGVYTHVSVIMVASSFYYDRNYVCLFIPNGRFFGEFIITPERVSYVDRITSVQPNPRIFSYQLSISFNADLDILVNYRGYYYYLDNSTFVDTDGSEIITNKCKFYALKSEYDKFMNDR